MRAPAALARLADRLDARDRRERLLLAGTVLVVLVVLWDVVVRAPLSERHAAAIDRAEGLESEIATLRDSREQLQQQLAADDDNGESPAARLRARIERIDSELQQRTARLISPEQMVTALRDVVADQSGIRLVRLENAPAEPIISVADESADAASADDVPRVYRHSVELVIEGRYLDVLEYLRRLEALEWRFRWDGLAVATQSYPVTRATVSLSTLSLAEDWIGV